MSLDEHSSAAGVSHMRYSVVLTEKKFKVKQVDTNSEFRFRASNLAIEEINSDLKAADFEPHKNIGSVKPDLTIVDNPLSTRHKSFCNASKKTLKEFMDPKYPLRGEKIVEIEITIGPRGEVNTGEMIGIRRRLAPENSGLFLGVVNSRKQCVKSDFLSVCYYNDTDLDDLEDVISKSQGYKIKLRLHGWINKAVYL